MREIQTALPDVVIGGSGMFDKPSHFVKIIQTGPFL
jgi:hypothetical protein